MFQGKETSHRLNKPVLKGKQLKLTYQGGTLSSLCIPGCMIPDQAQQNPTRVSKCSKQRKKTQRFKKSPFQGVTLQCHPPRK